MDTKFPKISLKNLFFILVMVLLPYGKVQGGINTKRLLKKLEDELAKREEYQQEKLLRISRLEKQLQAVEVIDDMRLKYNVIRNLYREYQAFNYDSAFKYAHRMLRAAYEMDNQNFINYTKTELAFTFLSSGLFLESLDTLNSINSSGLKRPNKIAYYRILARTYYDLGDYHSDGFYSRIYTKKGNTIMDSLIVYLSDTTAQYWMAVGLRRMKSNDYHNAMDAFNYVLSQFKITKHDYAILTSSLGWIYSLLGRETDAVDMLIKAAIADIQSSTNETVALRNLAVILYERGELEKAYQYIKIALEDATYYNARHRKMEISEILPIIESKRLSILEKQRKQLLKYGLITTILGLMVTLFAIIIYAQLKKLKKVRLILQKTNNELQAMNENLIVANKIKEEYIAFFFNINSEYIDRLEALQKTIHRKMITRQFDDIKSIINTGDLQKEREKLYHNFDQIFLKLFPKFVDEFNKLFKPEDQISLEKGNYLSTDLRIFALMRLGISDNEKIASFLNYSVNTIYTYKTKLKHKAIVSRDEFDNFIMSIKAF